VEFSWTKAHSGLVHNEIADTLATRWVKRTSYCPTNRFDVLPPDTEPEDVLEMRGVDSIITQTDKYDEDVRLLLFTTRAVGYGFGPEEARERADVEFMNFSRNVLGNSSAAVSDDSESDVPQGQDTIAMTGSMNVVQESQEAVKPYGQIIAEQRFGSVTRDEGVHMTTISEGLVDSPAVAPHAWSSSFAQARKEATRQQFSWMTESDQLMEPVPWEHLADAMRRKGEGRFQAIEQRTTEEDVMGSQDQPAPD
jgi:hypothetical protein